MHFRHRFIAASAIGCSLLAIECRAVNFGFDFIDAHDLDGDGIHEIVADELDLNQGSILRAIHSGSGAVLWEVPVAQGPGFFFKKALGTIRSVDGDEVRDIAYQELGNSVTLFAGADGSAIDTISIPVLNPADPNKFAVAVAQLPVDLTHDGIREIVIGSVKGAGVCPGGKNDTGFVYAVDPTDPGKALWISQGPLGSYNFGWDITPLGHDYDQDGNGDLLVTDNCRPKSLGLGKFSKGAAYIVSSKNGAILKEFTNPTVQPNPEFEGNVMFGFDALETADLDRDGIRDFFISEVNIDAGSGGQTAVDLISGSDGKVLCRYLSPNGGFDGFGSSLAGGHFRFGDPANSVYDFFDPPHDLLVGAPDLGEAYVVQIDPKHCGAPPLAKLTGLGGFGNRVGLLAPPFADPGQPGGGFLDLIIDAPLDGNGRILRHSGFDAAFGQAYSP